MDQNELFRNPVVMSSCRNFNKSDLEQFLGNMGDLSAETAELLSAEKVDYKLLTGYVYMATLGVSLLYKVMPGTIFGDNFVEVYGGGIRSDRIRTIFNEIHKLLDYYVKA
jgi:hypothetical protein